MERRPIIVQKFGGTSVGTIDRMRGVAEIVKDEKKRGHDVVVVVSAMSGETNRLIQLAESASSDPSPREMDQLLATGEQVSVALLAMILNESGVPAQSVLGFQMGMKTDAAHTKARIVDIDRARFASAFDQGLVLVAAGFQGIDPSGDLTTLGRGGSDTTAVAIAAGLEADFCDIYTDVDGVYTADPNICADARRLDRISYEEMLELASIGSKVLQIRSVEMAMKYEVPVRVRSTFTRGEGTLVTWEEPFMEGIVVAGVACDKNEARIALRRVPDHPGIAAKIFTPLSKANIVVDMIIQNTSMDGSTDLTFTVPRTDLKQAVKIMEGLARQVGIAAVEPDASIAKVSIVGVGMRSHAGVATSMFKALADEGINIKMISTSEIKISAVIEEKNADAAVRALHRVFNLGATPKLKKPVEAPADVPVAISPTKNGHANGSNGNGSNGHGVRVATRVSTRTRRIARGRNRRPTNGHNHVLEIVQSSPEEETPPSPPKKAKAKAKAKRAPKAATKRATKAKKAKPAKPARRK